jgi:hypothetical protein
LKVKEGGRQQLLMGHGLLLLLLAVSLLQLLMGRASRRLPQPIWRLGLQFGEKEMMIGCLVGGKGGEEETVS